MRAGAGQEDERGGGCDGGTPRGCSGGEPGGRGGSGGSGGEEELEGPQPLLRSSRLFPVEGLITIGFDAPGSTKLLS